MASQTESMCGRIRNSRIRQRTDHLIVYVETINNCNSSPKAHLNSFMKEYTMHEGRDVTLVGLKWTKCLKPCLSTSSQEMFLHLRHSSPLRRLSTRNMNLKDQPTEK